MPIGSKMARKPKPPPVLTEEQVRRLREVLSLGGLISEADVRKVLRQFPRLALMYAEAGDGQRFDGIMRTWLTAARMLGAQPAGSGNVPGEAPESPAAEAERGPFRGLRVRTA